MGGLNCGRNVDESGGNCSWFLWVSVGFSPPSQTTRSLWSTVCWKELCCISTSEKEFVKDVVKVFHAVKIQHHLVEACGEMSIVLESTSHMLLKYVCQRLVTTGSKSSSILVQRGVGEGKISSNGIKVVRAGELLARPTSSSWLVAPSDQGSVHTCSASARERGRGQSGGRVCGGRVSR